MYDPMVAKLIVWDADREQATRRMLRALDEYEIEGLKTLIPFHKALLATEQWARGRDLQGPARGQAVAEAARLPQATRQPAEAEEAETVEQTYAVEVSGKRFDVRVVGPPFAGGGAVAASNGARPAPRGRTPERRVLGRRAAARTCSTSPLQGNMWKVLVKQGDTVEEGQLLCIIEAMKMENEITAHKAGMIVELPITEGAPIQAGAPIATINAAED